MRTSARGAAEFGRQLALGLGPVEFGVVAPNKAHGGGGWAMVLVPCQLEKICARDSIETFATLLEGLRSAEYRVAMLTSGPLCPILAAKSDQTHQVDANSPAGQSVRNLDRLEQNASLRSAGVSLVQALRPRLVIQYGVPFLDAGIDVSYYGTVPLVLYWEPTSHYEQRREKRFLSFVRAPLGGMATSMERNTIGRSSVVVTTSAGDRESVVQLGAGDNRVLVLEDEAASSRPDRWVTAILDRLEAPPAVLPTQLARVGSTREDVNGHGKRVAWIESRLNKTDRAVEFGCGTGVMVTIPLVDAGYDVRGVDLDHESIELGRKLLRERGLDPNRLLECDLTSLADPPNVIIASEVLEHVPDGELDRIIGLLYRTLPPDGHLLVTVPNGYGWFELESALWFRLGLGRMLEKLGVIRIVKGIKMLFGVLPSNRPPSTLADSPHVQRFTKRSIVRLLRRHGFRIDEVQGSVLMCGPLTGLIMEGFGFFPPLNARAGRALNGLAAGFYIACTRPSSIEQPT